MASKFCHGNSFDLWTPWRAPRDPGILTNPIWRTIGLHFPVILGKVKSFIFVNKLCTRVLCFGTCKHTNEIYFLPEKVA